VCTIHSHSLAEILKFPSTQIFPERERKRERERMCVLKRVYEGKIEEEGE